MMPSPLGPDNRVAGVVLAALYLRGIFRQHDPPAKSWPLVVEALRKDNSSIENVSDCLRKERFSQEAAILQSHGLLSRAEELVCSERVLTACDPKYPQRWIRALGSSSPPAFWRCGEIPAGPFLTVVGSRRIGSAIRVFARDCARVGAELGFSIASGGAAGCDSEAAKGALSAQKDAPLLLEVLPCGLKRRRTSTNSCALSLCEPWTEFSVAAAMERNQLLYAISDFAIIAQARFKEGGTWKGAIEANRRKLCRLIVRNNPRDKACRALLALGATPLANPEDLDKAMASPTPQPVLEEFQFAYPAA